MQLQPVKSASFAGTTMEQGEGVGESGAGSFVVKAASTERSSKQAAPSAKKAVVAPKSKAVSDKKSKKKDEDQEDGYDDEEAVCGLSAFRKITDVVCLTKVVRAPNALGALCTCIRELRITDDVWTLLQSRVIQENDERLTKPPFSTSACKIIVQRHLLRCAMSNEAVLAQSPKMKTPVYLVTARDDVQTADAGIRAEVQSMLQNEHTLRKTARKPSLLLIYEGARMLLEGKDCRLLGLMNGAEVVVEKIILSDSEAWTEPRTVNPNVTQLKYMPTAIIVRVPGVEWILPEKCLGPLHIHALPADLRGIFIVRPDTSMPFKVLHKGIKWRVTRTQLNLIPAN